MNNMKKIVAGFVVLLGLFAGVALATMTPGDGYSKTFNASLASPAEVVAAESGKALAVRGMILRSDTAGVISLRDGAGDGTVLASVYVAANENVMVGHEALGDGEDLDGKRRRPGLGNALMIPGDGGIRTSAGNALWASHSAGGVLTATFMVVAER
jgi:hypothetical protein